LLTEQELQELVWIQAHWAEHYQISVIDDVWRAERKRHATEIITADSAHQLRDRLRDDYAELATHEQRLLGLAARAGRRPGLSTEDQTWLNFLRMHYENHYQIDCIEPAEDVAAFWQGVWRGPGEPGTLVASSPIGLRDLMRDDASRRRFAQFKAELDAKIHPAFRDRTGPAGNDRTGPAGQEPAGQEPAGQEPAGTRRTGGRRR
jgi:hypothetical protein